MFYRPRERILPGCVGMSYLNSSSHLRFCLVYGDSLSESLDFDGKKGKEAVEHSLQRWVAGVIGF